LKNSSFEIISPSSVSGSVGVLLLESPIKPFVLQGEGEEEIDDAVKGALV
jgi:hypothetical protein